MGATNPSAIARNLHGLSDEQLLQLVVAGRAKRRGNGTRRPRPGVTWRRGTTTGFAAWSLPFAFPGRPTCESEPKITTTRAKSASSVP